MMGPGVVPGQPRAALTVIPLQHASADSTSTILERLFAGKAEIVSDVRTNQLIIKTDAETQMEIAQLVQVLDVPASKKEN
jgi:hypothetical protein